MKHRRPMIGGVLVLLLGAVAGCAPSATYPAVESTARFNKPNFEPLPTLMAKAVDHMHEAQADPNPLVYNLPQATPASVFNIVDHKLAGQGRRMQSLEEPAYHVEQVRSRLNNAEVDVIYPRTDGGYQRSTVYLRHNVLKGWRVVRTRLWRYAVEAPEPSYVPPPPPVGAVLAAPPG